MLSPMPGIVESAIAGIVLRLFWDHNKCSEKSWGPLRSRAQLAFLTAAFAGLCLKFKGVDVSGAMFGLAVGSGCLLSAPLRRQLFPNLAQLAILVWVPASELPTVVAGAFLGVLLNQGNELLNEKIRDRSLPAFLLTAIWPPSNHHPLVSGRTPSPDRGLSRHRPRGSRP
jgi:hypothetical protein